MRRYGVARLEVAVRSPIRFGSTHELSAPAETVGIEFENRLFVWHALEPRDDPAFGYEEFDPTVTVTVQGTDDERNAADTMQRFLSVIAFWLGQPAEALNGGMSGEPDSFHPAITRARRTYSGLYRVAAPRAIELRPERNVRLAVSYYREALNAGTPFYRFLAFWNSLEAALTVNQETTLRDAFINREAQHFVGRWNSARHSFPTDPATTLVRDSRNAIAHVLRGDQRCEVDPDKADDRERLDHEARLLEFPARRAIEQRYPGAIMVTSR